MIRPDTACGGGWFRGFLCGFKWGSPVQGGGNFTAARFHADVQGHPGDRTVTPALEGLAFFSNEVKILGVYPAHPYRLHGETGGEA